MISQILAHTPIWVFFVFFVLAFYGWMQSRTREAGKGRVLMLPIIMTFLSVGGVLSSFGAHPPAIIAWVIGFAVALGLNQVIRAPSGVTYSAATGRFHLPGSWTPLVLMMLIYFAKYAVGATLAMRPDIAATDMFAAVLSCLFGGLSGTFFARFLRIWSTTRKAGPTTMAAGGTSNEWGPAA